MRKWTSEDTAKAARAFNEGSNARVAGTCVSECPYDGKLGTSWVEGWSDVHNHWGVWVKGRWEHKPLPRVRPR